MTGPLLVAAVAAMLIVGAVREIPETPWAARRRRREAADLAAWSAYRAAFYNARGPARPARAGRPRGTAPRRYGPRMWLVVDPVD